jgi:hypothetical protein
MPGQSPPQVTIAAVVYLGSKNKVSLGPAFSRQLGGVLVLIHVLKLAKETSVRILSLSITKLKILSPEVLLKCMGEGMEGLPKDAIVKILFELIKQDI